MKQPSLDAIRKFKELQERKKQQETEKKIKEKLSILEHRAAQGDRKAKTELRIIEKVKEDRNKQAEHQRLLNNGVQQSREVPNNDHHKLPNRTEKKKAAKVETDFDELMRLAASNNNQIRREEIKKPPQQSQKILSIPKKPREATDQADRLPLSSSVSAHPNPSRTATMKSKHTSQQIAPKPKLNHKTPPMPKGPVTLPSTSKTSIQHQARGHQTVRLQVRPNQMRPVSESYARSHQYGRNDHYNDYSEEDDYEDDYEQDGFVVDEDDGEVQDEVSKTIKSVFGYDKRRCDLREAELDRQYRQIGRVSTFEDLEREERRASRLAAAEDARALRDEEERKRLKRIRKRGY